MSEITKKYRQAAQMTWIGGEIALCPHLGTTLGRMYVDNLVDTVKKIDF